MTIFSPTMSSVASRSVNKGSTYGEASSSSSHHPFQEPYRSDRSSGADRAEVLHRQTSVRKGDSRSITKLMADESRLAEALDTTDLEKRFKLLYFLCDMGIVSARESARIANLHYIMANVTLMVGE